MTPGCAELGYGWIEPGGPVAGLHSADFRRVRQLWEKHAVAQAEEFRTRGWCCNSFVMVGRASTMLELIEQAVPSVPEAFVSVRPTLRTQCSLGRVCRPCRIARAGCLLERSG